MTTEAPPQLKPCPWCGSEKLEYDAYQLDDEHLWTTITCKDCGAESADQGNIYDWDPNDEEEREAAVAACKAAERVKMVDRWNTRSSSDHEACPLCGNTNIDRDMHAHANGTKEGYRLCNAGFAGDCHTQGPVVNIAMGGTDDEVDAILDASWMKRIR